MMNQRCWMEVVDAITQNSIAYRSVLCNALQFINRKLESFHLPRRTRTHDVVVPATLPGIHDDKVVGWEIGAPYSSHEVHELDW